MVGMVQDLGFRAQDVGLPKGHLQETKTCSRRFWG